MAHDLAPADDGDWILHADGYHALRENGIESRFAVSNGFLGVRAARAVSRGPTWVSWLRTLPWASWPRTYVAGLFEAPNTDPPVPALVPLADWLRVCITLDGEALLLRSGTVLAHRRSLDLRRGLLVVEWRHRTRAGIAARVRTLRLVSQADRAIGLQALRLDLDRDGVEVALEASFEGAGLGLQTEQLEQDLGVWRTLAGKGVAMAGSATLSLDGQAQEPVTTDVLRWTWRWRSASGQVAALERLLATTRADDRTEDPALAARAVLARARQAGGQAVLAAHEAAWDARWQASDIEIEGDPALQRALRFAVYHLDSAANPDDPYVSIGARGLTGDSYIGHVFWDTDIYLLPFYIATWPEAARALVMYRFHTLPGARAKAARGGWRGAMYAWEATDTGEETTPDEVIGPAGKLVDVLSGRQEQHITADVAYAVWHYWQATGDDAFLLQAGAEIMLETARFWAARAVPEADGKHHIRGVIGPDEYHENIDDNAFTNHLARWNIARALDLAALLRDRWPDRWAELSAQLDLGEAEMAHWREVAAALVTGLHSGTGVIEQFAGYSALEYIDLARYADRTAPLDVVLGHDRVQQSQVVKQADVVALLALLPEEFDARTQEANFRHYEPRCDHGSSLSRSMHALVAARLGDMDTALRYLEQTASIDLSHHADSAGGVHVAALGGLWQAVMLGFVGLALTGEALSLEPRLPPHWTGLACRVCWRGRRLHLRIGQRGGRVNAVLEAGAAMTLVLHGKPHTLAPGAPARLE